ncbi:MAG: hypothetical protein QMD04_11745 [Anaerolineales bacterium]|nr:hypothetical protein [Anaerolineales bacterium]
MKVKELYHPYPNEMMKRTLMTVPAHFDGTQIQFDVGIELKPGTHLLVTILDEEPSHKMLVWNAMKLSEAAFAHVWDNEEDALYDSL